MRKLAAGLIFLGFAIGNLWKFSFFSSDVHVSVLDISVGLVFLLTFFWKRSPLIELIKKSSLRIPLLLFFVIALLSLLFSLSHFGSSAAIVGSFYLLRWLVYTFFFASLSVLFPRSTLTEFIYVFSLFIIGTSLIQYLFFPDIRFLQVSEWDPHYFRVVGNLLDPGFIGLLLIFVIIHFSLNFQSTKPYSFIIWSLAYLSLAFTYSRSSFLAFLAAMAAIAVIKKSWKIFLGAALLLGVTLLILPRSPDGEGVKLERTSSIAARIQNWRNSLTVFFDHPILGVGFNVYRYAQKAYGFTDDSKWLKSHAGAGADSSLLFVAATAGMLGLTAYLWYLRSLFRLHSVHSELAVALVALLVHSLFLNSLFYPQIMLWLSLLVAQGL